jgi:hypothetical protein
MSRNAQELGKISPKREIAVQGFARRDFLRQGGYVAGAALVAPPLERLSRRLWIDDEVTAATRLVGGKASMFAAEAQGLELLVLLLTGAAAIVTLLEYLGIRPAFGSQVNYAAGSDCRYQFQDFHARWQNAGYQAYAGISQCPYEQRMMVLSAMDGPTPSQSSRAEMVGRDDRGGPILLTGEEPGVMCAASKVAKNICHVGDGEVAKIGCVTSRLPITVAECQQTVWRYRNAQGGYVLYWPDQTGATSGKMALHVSGKTDPARPINCRFEV